MRSLSTAVAFIAIATVIGIGSADAVTKPSNLNRVFAGGTQFTGEVAANSDLTIDGDLKPAAIVPATATKLTIASGVITVTQNSHTVETQSAASSDDLDTISGGTAEELITLRPFSGSHDVVLKHGTGNIACPGGSDITLAELTDVANLKYVGSTWVVTSYRTLAGSAGGTVSVSNGGTGVTSLTAHYLPVGNGTSAVTLLAPGTSGYPLLSAGGSADPAYSQIGATGIATDAVTTAKILAANVTGPKIASTFIQPFAILGLDLSGGGAVATNIPCTGAQVGDVVAFITKVTGVGPIVLGTGDFETTITTAGQLKQTSLTNLDGVQYFGFLLKRN